MPFDLNQVFSYKTILSKLDEYYKKNKTLANPILFKINGWSKNMALPLSKSRKIIANHNKSYDVFMVEDLLSNSFSMLIDHLTDKNKNACLMVTTPTVASLYGNDLHAKLVESGIDCSLLVLDCDEENKSLEQVALICEIAIEKDLSRESFMIALGGGVCSDLVTMAAAMFRRGIRTIRIPTTLIGLVDASIGIKGAVNFKGSKSRLGFYHAPDIVLIDPSFLSTLPIDHLQNGFAEIIKMAIVRENDLFELCSNHALLLIQTQFQTQQEIGSEIIWRAVCSMLEELEQNLFEDQTSKRLVDFGHTFSPHIEEESGYKLSHGQAVSIDMAFSAAIAYELGKLQEKEFYRIVTLLTQLGLPVDTKYLTEDLCEKALNETVLHRRGFLNFVTPIKIGESIFIEEKDVISSVVLKQALESLRDFTSHAPS